MEVIKITRQTICDRKWVDVGAVVETSRGTAIFLKSIGKACGLNDREAKAFERAKAAAAIKVSDAGDTGDTGDTGGNKDKK